MATLWRQLDDEQIKSRVFDALDNNVSYASERVFGVPGSQLDEKVFHRDAEFLRDAPFLSTMLANPNHIGCHTLASSEPFFAGTQAIERELVEICGSEILGADRDELDGYVASGGTEANLQAVWIYRNLFRRSFDAAPSEICILCSSDSHYSLDKAADLLSVPIAKVAVDPSDRRVSGSAIARAVDEAMASGRKYFIVIANMMTTMFGSIDDVGTYAVVLDAAGVEFRVHVDGAYGGFYYPFTHGESQLDFRNPLVSSATLDAHKMLQAPYGTGMFLVRKGLIREVVTREASYVEGHDYTLIGSRSGANAVAVWMILMKNGPDGWQKKIDELQSRTRWLCEQLDDRRLAYFRHPNANIIAIDSDCLDPRIAEDYWLVPDDHDAPQWYKIVVMDHVTVDKLTPFVASLPSN